MAELTARQQQEIETAVAEVMSADKGLRKERMVDLDLDLDLDDLKDVFCKNWEMVKKALTFIAGLPAVPQRIKDAIKKIIELGDRIHKIVCGKDG